MIAQQTLSLFCIYALRNKLITGNTVIIIMIIIYTSTVVLKPVLHKNE